MMTKEDKTLMRGTLEQCREFIRDNRFSTQYGYGTLYAVRLSEKPDVCAVKFDSSRDSE
jgi:hypothetical protein